MLSKIWIKNFALIQELNFDFKKGYTVITGETGSGKSILLGAINLILGERADFSLIGPDSNKTFVEAEFNITDLNLKDWFLSNDVDYEQPCLVRREINNQGRSRAFVNDTPVSLQQVKQLTERLINIHSQHRTTALRDKNFQGEILDVLAGIEQEVLEFSADYNTFKSEIKKLRDEEERVAKADANRDYLTFQLEEITMLNLESNVYSKLEEELGLQQNMDDIILSLDAISNSLVDDAGSLPLLKTLKSKLERSKIEDAKLVDLTLRLNSSILELEDIAADSSSYLDRLEKNPERLIELTTKIDAYNRVLQKHKSSSQLELMELENNWKSQLSLATEGQAQILEMKASLERYESKLNDRAKKIHEKRQNGALKIQKQVTVLLDELKMPNTTLQFELTPTVELNSKGRTAVSLLFSTNKGIPVQPIEKIASGGELSRLMLAIQCLISENKHLPSIIFDEIDTGVSGEVAQKIGKLLNRMGKNLQLIAISHLPQVAGKATSHIKVEKFEKSGRTLSSLKQLSKEERVEEIARLMSGEDINEAALINAKSLMDEI